MHEIFADYLDLLGEANSARQTYTNNRRSFELFDEFLAERDLDPKLIRLAHLREWLKLMVHDYKASTIAQHATSVRAAYKHAHELGVIDINPTSGLTKLIPRPVDKLPETLSAEELRAVHGSIQTGREEMVFHMLLWTGARAAELRPLRWQAWDGSYVDLENDQLVLNGKGGKIRFVPIHPILHAKLENWRGESGLCVIESKQRQQMSHQTWTTEVIGLLDRVGIEREKKSHLFRKSLNTNLLRQEIPEHVLDSLFGWAPTTVRTKHYSGVAKNEVRDAVLKAYSDDPVVPEQDSPVVVDSMIATLQVEIERLRALKLATA